MPLQLTVSPPTPMTRLIRSFSSAEGIRPMKLRDFWRPRTTGLLLGGGFSGSQPPGSWKTTTSPRVGVDPNHGVSLSTSTRSPCWRVFCIESDGMENAWTRNVLISSASTRAMPISIGSSFQKERGLRSAACPEPPEEPPPPSPPGPPGPPGPSGSAGWAPLVPSAPLPAFTPPAPPKSSGRVLGAPTKPGS